MPSAVTSPHPSTLGLIEAVAAPVLVVTHDLAVVALNGAAGRALSIQPEAAIGLPLSLLFGRECEVREGWLYAGESDRLDIAREGGRSCWRFACRPMPGEASAGRLVLTGSDVTEEEGARRSQRELERQLQALMANVAGVATDSTERRRHEAAIAQAQKMESLGVMAGTVAHDFNNLLTAILGFAGLLKLSPSLDPQDREQLHRIEQAARRGADIAGRLLSFSRGGLARFVEVDLRDVARESVDLVRPALSGDVGLDLELPAEPVVVEGDPVQLQQAVLNVVLNARDAVSSGGAIVVTVQAGESEGRVVVEDSGEGMDDSTRARVFEPFFTTKDAGAGTGLGLAITYGVVRGHGGHVELHSEPGRTRFELTFPLMERGLPAQAGSDPGDGNLVLLVDDDELVRHSMSQALSRLGFNVVEVASGGLAIELVRARPGRFAAMLLDLVMPGMTGREVFHAVAEVRPDLPVILCTGYAAGPHIDDVMKRSIAGLLQKPFTPERLMQALGEAGVRPER